MYRVGITGTGSYLPRNRHGNGIFDNDRQEIRDRIASIGIQTRAWASKDEPLPVMMAVAATEALRDAGLGIKDIDSFYFATNSTDPFLVPALSARTHYLLDAPRINGMDIVSGCCSAVQATGVAKSQLIEKRLFDNLEEKEYSPRHMLVVAGDVLSNVTKTSSRVNRGILADGAGAVVISDLPDTEKDFGILSSAAYIEGNPHWISYTSGYGDQPLSDFDMNGTQIHKFVLRCTSDMAREAFARGKIPLSEIANAKINPHQVNRRSLGELAARLSEELGLEISLNNFYLDGTVNHGNTSCASCLIGIDHCNKHGRFTRGDIIWSPVWGAGMMSAYLLQRWGKERSLNGSFDNRPALEELLGAFNDKYATFLRDVKSMYDRRTANKQ